MPTIRFEISKELNRDINKIKGNTLKIPYSKELFEKAVAVELRKQQQKQGG